MPDPDFHLHGGAGVSSNPTWKIVNTQTMVDWRGSRSKFFHVCMCVCVSVWNYVQVASSCQFSLSRCLRACESAAPCLRCFANVAFEKCVCVCVCVCVCGCVWNCVQAASSGQFSLSRYLCACGSPKVLQVVSDVSPKLPLKSVCVCVCVCVCVYVRPVLL